MFHRTSLQSCMRSLTTSAIALVCTAIPALATDAVRGVPVATGDRLTARIDYPGDVDAYAVSLPYGAALKVTLDADRKSRPTPHLSMRLLQGDDAPFPLDSFIEGTADRRSVLDLPPIQAPGVWRLEIHAKDGETGAYRIRFQVIPMKKLEKRGVPVLPGASLLLPLGTLAGDRVKVAVSFAEGGSGESKLLGSDSELLVPVGGAWKFNLSSATAQFLISGKGTQGTTLSVTNGSLAPTEVDVRVSIRRRKSKGRKIALSREPVVTGLTPEIGRDGDPVRIHGTSIPLDATVYFNGSPTEVVEGDESGILCNAPDSDDSVAGHLVPVVVVLADGQPTAVPMEFQFLGVPRPLDASPRVLAIEGGTAVTVSGEEIREGASIQIRGVPATSVVLEASGVLKCVAPPGAAGPAALHVLDEFGRTSTESVPLLYADPPTFSPTGAVSIPSYRGASFVVHGTNFRQGLRLVSDGVEAVSVTVHTSTRLTAVLDAGPAGPATFTLIDEIGRGPVVSNVLTRNRSWNNVTTAVLPPVPTSTDYFGRSVEVGRISGTGLPQILVSMREPELHKNAPGLTGIWAFTQNQMGVLTDVSVSMIPRLYEEHQNDFGQADHLLLDDFNSDGGLDLMMFLSTPPIAPFKCTTIGSVGSYTMQCEPSTIDQTGRATRALTFNQFIDGFESQTPQIPSLTPEHITIFGPGVWSGHTDGGYEERGQSDCQAIGDLDGDGDFDLVIASERSITSPVYEHFITYTYIYQQGNLVKVPTPGKIQVGTIETAATRILFKGGQDNLLSHGSFVHRLAYQVPEPVWNLDGSVKEGWSASAVALGDLDGDGSMEILLASRHPRPSLSEDHGSALRVMRRLEGGSFALDANCLQSPPSMQVQGSLESWQGSAMLVADLTGDGRPEVILGRERALAPAHSDGAAFFVPCLRIFRNDGEGNLHEDTASFLDSGLLTGLSAIHTATHLDLRDLDGDGVAELIIGGPWSRVDASYGNEVVRSVLGTGQRRALRILKRDQNGTFFDKTETWVEPPINGDLHDGLDYEIADLNDDGFLDLVVISDKSPSSPGVTTFPNRGMRIFMSR